jgi:hypothetical protein
MMISQVYCIDWDSLPRLVVSSTSRNYYYERTNAVQLSDNVIA